MWRRVDRRLGRRLLILILSADNDPHAREAASVLHKRGVPYRRFDSGKFPAYARISVRHLPDAGSLYTLRDDDDFLDLLTVTAIWLRRPSRPTPSARIEDPEIARCVVSESAALVEDIWQTLDARWLPGPPASGHGS